MFKLLYHSMLLKTFIKVLPNVMIKLQTLTKWWLMPYFVSRHFHWQTSL